MGKGWALVGDAVCFKDPGMAQGIHDAICGARILSNILSKYKGQSDQSNQMSEEYQKAIEDEFMVRFHMDAKFRRMNAYPNNRMLSQANQFPSRGYREVFRDLQLCKRARCFRKRTRTNYAIDLAMILEIK